jgi:N-acetylmuramoyl-L-alanine amidase
MCIADDTKTHNGKLVGLRGVNTVGVLVESANLKNRYDEQNMPSPAFQQMEARKISEGIINYYRSKNR